MPLARWDSGHYREILVSGYRPGTPVSPTAAFLPLYPLIARPVAYWLGPDGALVAVSNVAALIGAFFLYAWSKSYTDPPTGFWCVILATAYPPAMFLSAGYSDGLFFLEVAMALWLLQRRRVLLAGCVSGLATGTRPTGLALAVVVLAWAWVHAARRRWPSRLIRLLLLGSVSVSGFLAYQAYLWRHYGRADAFVAAQTDWPAKDVRNPLIRVLTLQPVLENSVRPVKYALRGQFDELCGPQTWNPLLGLLILILAVTGLVRAGNVPRVVFLLPVTIFLMAYLPDPAGGSRMVSIARYQTAALPCFLLLAKWALLKQHRLVLCVLVAGQVALQCVYARAFVNWEWVG